MSDGNNRMLYMKHHGPKLGDLVVNNNDHASVSDITEAEGIGSVHLLGVPQEEDRDDEYIINDNIRFALKENAGVDAEVKSTVSSLTNDAYPSYDELQKKYTRRSSWKDENDVENPAVIQNTGDEKGLPWYSRVSRTNLSDPSRTSSQDQESPTTHRSNSQSDTSTGRSSGFLSYVAGRYNGSKKSIVVTLVIFCMVLIAIATSLSVSGASNENAGAGSDPSADPTDPSLPGDDPCDEDLHLEGRPEPTVTSKGSKSSKSEVQLATTNDGSLENVHTLTTTTTDLEAASNNDENIANQSWDDTSGSGVFDDDFVNSVSTAIPTTVSRPPTAAPLRSPSDRHPNNGANTESPVLFHTNTIRTTMPSHRPASKPNEYVPPEHEAFKTEASIDDTPVLSLFEISTSEPSILIAEKLNLPPTREPSPYAVLPPTDGPSSLPTSLPTYSRMNPPSRPTLGPSPDPTFAPSTRPTNKLPKPPSTSPTPLPSRRPSNKPTLEPTPQPTPYPSEESTPDPSQSPSKAPITPRPTLYPSENPTPKPSQHPSKAPITPRPTPYPSEAPVTPRPTPLPSQEPITYAPTLEPTPQPTPSPTERPITYSPTPEPAPLPTPFPSVEPVTAPPSPEPNAPTRDPIVFQSIPEPVDSSTETPTYPPLTPTPEPTEADKTSSPTYLTPQPVTSGPETSPAPVVLGIPDSGECYHKFYYDSRTEQCTNEHDGVSDLEQCCEDFFGSVENCKYVDVCEDSSHETYTPTYAPVPG